MQYDFKHHQIQVIKELIHKELACLPISYPLEIIKYDGIKAQVKILLKDYENVTLDDICIMQSPYLHLPIKQGDKGIGINAGYVFNELLEDKDITQNIKSVGGTALVFIPFVSESIKASDIESTILYNEARDSTLTLKENNLTYKNENTELKIEGSDIEIDNKSVQIKISGSDIIISGGTLKFENAAIKIEGMQGALGKAFEQVFSAMDLLSTGLTGPSSNPAAYNGGKEAFKQLIKQIVE